MNNNRYWEGKEKRAKEAQEHIQFIGEHYSDSVLNSITNTSIFDSYSRFEKKERTKTSYSFMNTDTVSAIFKLPEDAFEGKVAVLNFASYKHPGGGFLKGSCAQEECLCHASTLYNVLSYFEKIYYAKNRLELNKALYRNKALYSQDIMFFKENEKPRCVDVITCACPNKGTAQYYNHVTNEENYQALAERIIFVRNIAEEMGVDTLILGAFGAGVFRQNPRDVATLMKEKFKNTCIKHVIYAVPGNDENAKTFRSFF